MKRAVCIVAVLMILGVPSVFAQHVSASAADNEALVSGYEAYRNEDWTSAMFFFRKAVSVSGGTTDETWYMLIMSEMYAGEYQTALTDCQTFMQKFAFSMYLPYIHYQKGRCQHFLNQNESAVLTLSDFCHQYPSHDLYASALYWIAESFYAEYNYDSARGLYERIAMDFPGDTKVGASQYRIDAIDQKAREEKLLYLLKVTGEENLAAREDYERRIKRYEAEDKLGLRKQLTEAQQQIVFLQNELEQTRLGGTAGANGTGTAAHGASGGVHDVVDTAPAAGTATGAAGTTTAAFGTAGNGATSAATAGANGTNNAMATGANGGAGNASGTLAEHARVENTAGTSGAGGYGAAASTYVPDPNGDPEVEALKRKARQLQYILDEQNRTENEK